MKIKEEGLIGNEKIEEAIAALQREPTQELLAHALTVVRRRIRENGQVIVAVEPQAGDGPLQIRAIQTPDGKNWWMVFTSFEEEVKGGGSVMSTFRRIWDSCFRRQARQKESMASSSIHGIGR